MKRAAVRALVSCALLVVGTAGAVAQDAVEMRPIDQATVRVVSVIGADEGELRVGHGTGVIVDEGGWVLTAAHVVADADYVVVVAPGRDRGQPAIVVPHGGPGDLAVLRTAPGLASAIDIARGARLRAGSTVQASGYPLDPRERYPAAASGQVARPLNDGRVQLSMSLNPGNSGGPIIDDSDRLVGIVSQGADPRAGAQGLVIMEPVAHLSAALSGARSANAPPPASSTIASDVVLERIGARQPPSTADRAARLRATDGARGAEAAVLALEAEGTRRAILADAGTGPDGLDLGRRATYDELGTRAGQLRARAMSDDPALAQRYGGSSAVMGAVGMAGVSTDPEYVVAPSPAPGQTTGPSTGPSPYAPTLTQTEFQRRPVSFGLGSFYGASYDTHPNVESFNGFSIGFALDLRVEAFAHPFVRVQGIVGPEIYFGTFRNDFAFSFVFALGARVQLGPRLLHGYLEAAYTPGFTSAESRSNWTGVGYRVGAGVTLGFFELGIAWREQSRDAETPIRAFFGTLGIGY